GGQIANRQRAIRDDAEERDSRHQQAGRDRTPDEDLGEVHGCPAIALASPVLSALAAAASAPTLSAPAAPTRTTTGASARSADAGVRIRFRHARPVFEPELTFGDDCLARLQPFFNHHLLVHPP